VLFQNNQKKKEMMQKMLLANGNGLKIKCKKTKES